jgi:hypothetical protein
VVVPPKMARAADLLGRRARRVPPPSAGWASACARAGSMPPGMTSLPVASTTRATSRGRCRARPTATMRSPSTPTSHAPTA